MRTGIDDGPRLDGSDIPERKDMATKVKLVMEDGTERHGFIDMRSFRERKGNLHYDPPPFCLDVAKPLCMRRGGKNCQLKIWFVDDLRIYGAYRYFDSQAWIQHAWFLDGSALARIRPHNNDLIYQETETIPEPGALPMEERDHG